MTRGRVFSREFKLAMVRQIADGAKRPTQLCREHRLNEVVLLRWRHEYETRDEAAFTPRESGGDDAPQRRAVRQRGVRGAAGAGRGAGQHGGGQHLRRRHAAPFQSRLSAAHRVRGGARGNRREPTLPPVRNQGFTPPSELLPFPHCIVTALAVGYTVATSVATVELGKEVG